MALYGYIIIEIESVWVGLTWKLTKIRESLLFFGNSICPSSFRRPVMSLQFSPSIYNKPPKHV